MLPRSSHSLKHKPALAGRYQGVNSKKSKVPFAIGSAGDTGGTDLSHCLIVPLRQPGIPEQRPVPTRSRELPKPCGTTTVPSPATLTIRPLCQPGVYSPVDGRTVPSVPGQHGDPDSPGPASAAGEVHSGRDPHSAEGQGHRGTVPPPTHLCFLKDCISKGARGIPLLPPVPTRQGK